MVVVTCPTGRKGPVLPSTGPDDAVAQWKGRQATVYTYDNNSGQTTATVTGDAIYPFRNTAFDTSDGESTKAGSVMSVSVGNNVVDIV